MTEGPSTVDRQSPVPYYQQVADVLEARITAGEIGTGERLPSEKDLGVEFGLARATIRQALQQLEARGVVQRVANRGVFAGQPTPDHGWVIQNSEGFLENAVGRQNRAVTTKVLRFGEARLPSFAARLLQVPEQATGFELVRLRYLDGTPAVYSINYIPPSVAPIVAAAGDVLAGVGSLSELFTRSGLPLRGAHRTIRAAAPAREVAEVLEVSETTPVLCIRSTSWTNDERRFDVYETWVRSDVVPLEVNVSSVDLSAPR